MFNIEAYITNLIYFLLLWVTAWAPMRTLIQKVNCNYYHVCQTSTEKLAKRSQNPSWLYSRMGTWKLQPCKASQAAFTDWTEVSNNEQREYASTHHFLKNQGFLLSYWKQSWLGYWRNMRWCGYNVFINTLSYTSDAWAIGS